MRVLPVTRDAIVRLVAGGFKQSSQRLDEGVCDDHSEAAFG
jgi:hypothetical protein